MPAVTGIGFLVKINTGTEGSPVWTTIGGQREATLNMNINEADTTSKDSSGWHEGLPTIRSWSVDFDALILETDAGQDAVENMFINKTQVQIQILTPAAVTYTGKATLTDFSYNMPHEGEATLSGTFTGTGALTRA